MKVDDLGAANDAHAVLSAEVLDGLGRETSLFRGLPNAAFTTHAFLSLEHETLFKRSWVFAGRAGEVPKRGDVKPIQVVGRALFLVRGADERVRVFHNVCPHRGARLVIEPLKETSTLTCPYHAWSYELDGSLKGRPHFHGPDRHDRGSNGAGDSSREDRVCLFEVRNAVWHDWVFVNLDGAAQSFDDYMTPIRGHFEEWDLSQFRLCPPRPVRVSVQLEARGRESRRLLSQFQGSPEHGGRGVRTREERPLPGPRSSPVRGGHADRARANVFIGEPGRSPRSVWAVAGAKC